jgi:hypothetical protein
MNSDEQNICNNDLGKVALSLSGRKKGTTTLWILVDKASPYPQLQRMKASTAAYIYTMFNIKEKYSSDNLTKCW